ncbi:phosphonate ABC transporter, permease protein PhnE [Hansschlegelia quercus]|uniref:Phosphonate ABC transporter, permease protein PhnE n=1 Tax=Hansschlegelia quercus TaxID=2528245 RepID=A0A4Q9GJM0_9HYPH|nr:phosphonate ABC transporter, permease protein PhnE [Hansschlegelia quercus]TBN51782.1 phosphonate ABC transporter, permease protein PhnE [Hansschlegelia quercus]
MRGEPPIRAVLGLAEGRARVLLGAYDGAVRVRRLQTFAILAAVVCLALLSAYVAEVEPSTFSKNLYRFTNYLYRILPSLTVANLAGDVADWYWRFGVWMRLLIETLLIAYLGTLIGALGAVALCFAASNNFGRNKALRFATRRLLEFLRTVPEVVFALLFVIAFGLGPMAGVLALGIHSVGSLGKQFFEIVENVDMKPAEGVRASGGNWLHTVRFAAWPQVAPGFASYALMRFEINVRGASVMGFVGAGGIGQELISAIRQFYYSDVSAILLMILVTVVLIDLGAEQVRHRLIGLKGASA